MQTCHQTHPSHVGQSSAVSPSQAVSQTSESLPARQYQPLQLAPSAVASMAQQHNITSILLNCVSKMQLLHRVSKNVQTLKWYSSKLQESILMTFGRNIQNTLE